MDTISHGRIDRSGGGPPPTTWPNVGTQVPITLYMADSPLPIYGITFDLYQYGIDSYIKTHSISNPSNPSAITTPTGRTPLPSSITCNLIGKNIQSDITPYQLRVTTYSCFNGKNIASKALIIDLGSGTRPITYQVDASGAVCYSATYDKPVGAIDDINAIVINS